MNNDPAFYFTFLIIFTIWMLGKAWKHKQDIRNHKTITKSLENISELLNRSLIIRRTSIHRRNKRK